MFKLMENGLKTFASSFYNAFKMTSIDCG